MYHTRIQGRTYDLKQEEDNCEKGSSPNPFPEDCILYLYLIFLEYLLLIDEHKAEE
jgi:hypothetical protein